MKLAILFASALMLLGVNSFAGDNLLIDRKWTKYTMSSSSKGNLQGAAFLSASLNGIDGKDRIYVFKQASDKLYNSFDYYEPSTNSWYQGSNLFDWALGTHMGSATFGPSVVSSYTGSDGNTYQCHIPFVYVTGHAYLDASGTIVEDNASGSTRYITCVVLDLENQRIVKVFAFPNRSDDCIMAFDFSGNRMWVIGYVLTQSVGVSPYVIDEYRNVNMTDFLSGNPTKWNYTDIQRQTVILDSGGGTSSPVTVPTDGSPYCLSMQGGGPDADGIQRTLECGTVQDAFYHDNRIYIVTGRGSLYNRTEYVKIHSYNVNEGSHNYDKTIVAPLHGESQGLVYDGANIWVTLSGNGENGIYKYSSRNGDTSYDNLNSQEAQEISTGTYRITNGYELVWFLQQVYAGRTSINAVLANDIDLVGITLPTSYYVYDATKKFESQYAFCGTFDGQNHSITGLSINSTPFYNDGLFPWIIGATIKDVTVSGNITLTKADNNNSGSDISNVGLIGTAEGDCTISGVNVVDFTISNPNNLSATNVNALIGKNLTGKDFSMGNTFKEEHGSEGTHQYNDNGICIYLHDNQDGMFETATTIGEVYQIKNAGNLIWFAKSINAGTVSASANAILTADINLEGAKYGSFPGIGNASTMYTGTFDGNGKTINNFFMTVETPQQGLFGAIAESAVVKNFALNGNMTVTNTTDKYFIGAVVGRADGSSTVQDITSGVNILVEGKVRSGMGGVVGATMANQTAITINRCRYIGTITVSVTTSGATPQGIGGVIGNHRCGQVNNCLFDGTIITTVNDTESGANLNVGGLCGATSDNGNAKFNNCFSNGTLQILDNTYQHCGIFLGSAANTTTVTNCYYTDNAVSVETGSILVSAAGEPLKVAKVSDLTDNTLLYKLQNGEDVGNGNGNWTVGENYPIPEVGPLVDKPAHTHEYGADGFCVDGDGGMQKPETEDGYFIIVNRGNLWWFMNYVNGTLASDDPDKGVHASAKAKLGASINIQENTFAGINNFAGIFDGQGYTISGFKMTYTSTNKHGFFNNTSGVSETNKAQIRNLVLEGEMTVNGGFAFSGAVLGSADQNTLVEDVISKVNITVVSGKERYTGGVVGCLMKNTTSVNRCRYSGTITVKASYQDPNNYRQGVGGVVGASRLGIVTNCLFDGTIVTEADNTNVAGILGTASDGSASRVENCLSVGTFTLAGNSNGQCAAIFGACHKEQQGGAVIINNSYSIGTLECVGTASDYADRVTSNNVELIENLPGASKYAYVQLNAGDWILDDNGNALPGEGSTYFLLKDEVDAMPAMTSSADKIMYARSNKYMKGLISVCLPFALDLNMLPSANSKFLKYKKTENGTVIFNEVKAVPAGVPCFIELGSDFTDSYWVVEADKPSEIVSVSNPSTGIIGSFDKISTGEGKYKLDATGTKLLKTKSTSNCFPYRAYIALPEAATKASTMSIVTE